MLASLPSHSFANGDTRCNFVDLIATGRSSLASGDAGLSVAVSNAGAGLRNATSLRPNYHGDTGVSLSGSSPSSGLTESCQLRLCSEYTGSSLAGSPGRSGRCAGGDKLEDRLVLATAGLSSFVSAPPRYDQLDSQSPTYMVSVFSSVVRI
ncbi:unnamed protein product [Protopolystoma xenopodis]|uniref:Uncharacterized protein n=1 Tax=Protopolystoma xenopodis TaxID=117903 RepID=A0A3S5AI98_9PLAT|nr:unnamed protein product [Protopolystoma xenopodis]